MADAKRNGCLSMNSFIVWDAIGGMGWQLPPLNNRLAAFCHPWEYFPEYYWCFKVVFKERFPATFVELNLGLCDKLESSSMFSSTHIIQ